MISKEFSNWLHPLTKWAFLSSIFVLPFAKAGFEIFFVLTFLLWVLDHIMTRKPFHIERTLLVLVFLFIVSSLISAFQSGYPELTLRGIIKLVKYILIMLITIDVFDQPVDFEWLFAIGVAGLGLVLLDSLVQNLIGLDILFGYPIRHTNDQIRLTGPYQSMGLLASHIIVFLPLLIAFVVNPKGKNVWSRIGWGLFLLFNLYVLYRTLSRGSWLAAFGSLLIYSLLTRNRWFLLILIIGALIAPFVIPRQNLLHLDIFNREASLAERSLLWKRAMSVIEAKPWFGCGINTYTKNYPQFTHGEEWDLMKQRAKSGQYAHFGAEHIPGHPNEIPDYYVHNGYLQIAAETGLVSLALFFCIVGYSFYSGFQLLKKIEPERKPILIGIICGLIALLLYTFVDTILQSFQSAPLIWLFLGLLIAVNRIETE